MKERKENADNVPVVHGPHCHVSSAVSAACRTSSPVSRTCSTSADTAASRSRSGTRAGGRWCYSMLRERVGTGWGKKE